MVVHWGVIEEVESKTTDKGGLLYGKTEDLTT